MWPVYAEVAAARKALKPKTFRDFAYSNSSIVTDIWYTVLNISGKGLLTFFAYQLPGTSDIMNFQVRIIIDEISYILNNATLNNLTRSIDTGLAASPSYKYFPHVFFDSALTIEFRRTGGSASPFNMAGDYFLI
jgi:hypothetical protein